MQSYNNSRLEHSCVPDLFDRSYAGNHRQSQSRIQPAEPLHS